jgi:uncharacterized SAM-binding protein YcdF (DUF218 family)
LPPTGLLLLSMVGLAMRRRFPRSGTTLAWTGVLALLLLSIPAVGVLLVRALDSYAPFDSAQAAEAQAVVILGGGTRRDAPDYGGDTLGLLTLERVRYGARVARLTRLPVMVSGGTVLGGASEAKLMRAALEGEFGVSVRWAEDRSRTTHENAVNSAAILHGAGLHNVVLVAHSFDMLRARAEFAAVGIETIPAATELPSTGPSSLLDYLPSIGGLRTSYYAVYEILANLVRWIGMLAGH